MTTLPVPADQGGRAKPADAGSTMWGLLKQTFHEWSKDKAMKLSAALALYTIISLAPLLVISIKILSVIFGKAVASDQVQHRMSVLVGRAGSQAVQDMIANAARPGQGVRATVVSLVILLFSASAVFGELQDSLNTIWGVKPKANRGWWVTIRKRLLSIGMVFVIAFLLLVSLLVSMVLTVVTGWLLGPDAGWVAIGIDIIVSLIIVTLLLASLFRFLPDARIGWRDVMLGSLITAALFKLGQYGLGLYFRFGSSTSAYGAAGSFVAVLLWVYYSAWILFFGAEFTKVWAVRSGRQIVPAGNAVRVTNEDRGRRGMVPAGRLAHESRQQPPGKNTPGPGRRPPQGSEWEVKEQEWD